MNQMTTGPFSRVENTVTAAQAIPAVHAATVKSLAKAHRLIQGWASRSAISYVDSARLWSSGMVFNYADELREMNCAAARRFLELQDETLGEWAAWGRQRAQTSGANTMTKFIEQEMNLVGLIGQIFVDYLTNLAEFQENIEVGYAYWLSRKLGPLSVSQAHAAVECSPRADPVVAV